jgi:hypothetical protein
VPGTRLLAVSLTQSRTVYYMGFLIAAPQWESYTPPSRTATHIVHR